MNFGKYFILSLTLSLGLFATACSENGGEPAPGSSFSNSQLEFVGSCSVAIPETSEYFCTESYASSEQIAVLNAFGASREQMLNCDNDPQKTFSLSKCSLNNYFGRCDGYHGSLSAPTAAGRIVYYLPAPVPNMAETSCGALNVGGWHYQWTAPLN